MFKIGEVVAQPGTKAYGGLKIGEFSNGKSLYVPFAIVNGVKPEPVLVVSAGCLGYNVSCIEAVRRVLRDTDPKTLKGVLVASPIKNMAGFLSKSMNGGEIFNDHVSLEAAYPGNSEGTIEDRIADVEWREIITKANYHIDLMSGLGYFWIVNTYLHKATPEVKEKVLEMAKVFGAKIITDTRKMPWVRGRVCQEAVGKGIISIHSITGEYNGKWLVKADVEKHVMGITNIMKYLGMIQGKPVRPDEQHIITDVKNVVCNHGGFLDVKVELGQRVLKGDVLAKVTDLYYNVKEKVTSPVDGWVINKTAFFTVGSGDPAVQVACSESK
jgi:hypothetical protein